MEDISTQQPYDDKYCYLRLQGQLERLYVFYKYIHICLCLLSIYSVAGTILDASHTEF